LKKNQNVKELKNKEIIPLGSRIIFKNSGCIVVNKLKGEASEGAKKGIFDLRAYLSDFLGSEAQLVEAVNRLDVPVTGCALFALTKESLAYLNKAFAENNPSIEKYYWAIIEKPLFCLPESGERTHWIETNLRINKSFAYEKQRKGLKKAVLRYKIINKGDNYLFLEISLLSGRHHQIRAQLASMGLHIKGDLKYGARRSEKEGGIRLHARSLSFPNPLKKNGFNVEVVQKLEFPDNSNEKITVTADPPDIDNLWKFFLPL